jgi:hypothetical protein
MNQGKLFEEILKSINRPNPYPLHSQLRATPVCNLCQEGVSLIETSGT